MAGFASWANSIIRLNRRERTDKLGRLENYIHNSSLQKPEYKAASEMLLKRIRKRIRREQSLYRKRELIVFIFLCLLLFISLSVILFTVKI
ncbi:hypothetical protein GWK08_00965 [Leptobacterium flavescens]|uniref:Uncharacterized protein n=1 Tax=Leptobacterium flavescens TaxID=472055 RepID=A0A6P0UJ93_9FLAO|nr:hypothetical protein [Leptobacterium flavescens]NER11998.1 hypothetical protein [Leptobacterium flavescens]